MGLWNGCMGKECSQFLCVRKHQVEEYCGVHLSSMFAFSNRYRILLASLPQELLLLKLLLHVPYSGLVKVPGIRSYVSRGCRQRTAWPNKPPQLALADYPPILGTVGDRRAVSAEPQLNSGTDELPYTCWTMDHTQRLPHRQSTTYTFVYYLPPLTNSTTSLSLFLSLTRSLFLSFTLPPLTLSPSLRLPTITCHLQIIYFGIFPLSSLLWIYISPLYKNYEYISR